MQGDLVMPDVIRPPCFDFALSVTNSKGLPALPT